MPNVPAQIAELREALDFWERHGRIHHPAALMTTWVPALLALWQEQHYELVAERGKVGRLRWSETNLKANAIRARKGGQTEAASFCYAIATDGLAKDQEEAETLATARAQLSAAREVEAAARRLHRSIMDPDLPISAEYDRVAEWFYEETRLMAPGKSVPMEMASTQGAGERRERWAAWHRGIREALTAALRKHDALLEGGGEE